MAGLQNPVTDRAVSSPRRHSLSSFPGYKRKTFDTAVTKCRVRPKLPIWEQESGDLQPRHCPAPSGPRAVCSLMPIMLVLFMRQTPWGSLRGKQAITGESQGLELQEEACHPC